MLQGHPFFLNTHSLASRTLDFPLFLSYFPLSCWLLSWTCGSWNSTHSCSDLTQLLSLKKLISAADFQMLTKKPSPACPYKPAPPSSCSLMLLLGQPISISNQYVQPELPNLLGPGPSTSIYGSPHLPGAQATPGCITVSSSFPFSTSGHQQISWF